MKRLEGMYLTEKEPVHYWTGYKPYIIIQETSNDVDYHYTTGFKEADGYEYILPIIQEDLAEAILSNHLVHSTMLGISSGISNILVDGERYHYEVSEVDPLLNGQVSRYLAPLNSITSKYRLITVKGCNVSLLDLINNRKGLL